MVSNKAESPTTEMSGKVELIFFKWRCKVLRVSPYVRAVGRWPFPSKVHALTAFSNNSGLHFSSVLPLDDVPGLDFDVFDLDFDFFGGAMAEVPEKYVKRIIKLVENTFVWL